MILEIADIRIIPGQQVPFEAAVSRGLDATIAKAKGFRSFEVRHSMESPDRYVIQILWDTLEDHTVGFRGSPDMAVWRGVVGGFFAQPPMTEHFELVTSSKTEG